MKCKIFSDPVLRVFYLFYFSTVLTKSIFIWRKGMGKGGREGGDWPLRTAIAEEKRKVERDTETETKRQTD